MEKFTTARRGVAAPLPMVNIDTDQIIPKLLPEDDRAHRPRQARCSTRCATTRDGREQPDFVLNQPAYRKAQISWPARISAAARSREHAPWALLDFGIRCVIAPSFADIFYNNCFKNGILPIRCSPEEVDDS